MGYTYSVLLLLLLCWSRQVVPAVSDATNVTVQVWQRGEHTVLRRQVGQGNQILHRNGGEQHYDGTPKHCTILLVEYWQPARLTLVSVTYLCAVAS